MDLKKGKIISSRSCDEEYLIYLALNIDWLTRVHLTDKFAVFVN